MYSLTAYTFNDNHHYIKDDIPAAIVPNVTQNNSDAVQVNQTARPAELNSKTRFN